jgi:L-lactate dehydrogenase complex protein LldF
MELNPNHFLEAATIALHDIQLQTALTRGTGNATRNRQTAMGELEYTDALRQQGRGARLRALADLPELLEQVEANVTANGGHVLWAEDDAEANRHVVDICLSKNLKLGVKSKSMVTEEIKLQQAMAEHGIELIETDLGEFIIQISGDHPSHIIMPLMHRTKEAVRDIFMSKLDMPYTDDPAEMTAFARRTLREKYLQADFGMSGGNFLIAETGTLVIVTNEGNGRLSTSMPPVHIAVVGIEKVIPTWEDFATLLQLLTRSSTGQRLTVYVSMFNGPARSEDADGPREFYLVLVDNGRSRIYASEYVEALACIRCGACLNACPVYQNVGGHSYGSVYPGPIGAVLTPLFKGKENASPLPFASSLCGACKTACPVDINIPDMLIALRRDLQAEQDPVWQLGMKAYGFGFSHPLLFQAGSKAAALAMRYAPRTANGDLKALPFPADGWTENRDFPPLAEQSFHDWWRANRQNRPE